MSHTRGWHARIAARALHDRAPVQHVRAVPVVRRSREGRHAQDLRRAYSDAG